MSQFAVAYTTFENESDANKLAHLVIEKKLAACANVLGQGRSFYMWQEQICEDQEWYVLMKTSTQKLDDLKSFIKKEHPYDTPCFWSIKANASDAYFNWLSSSVD